MDLSSIFHIAIGFYGGHPPFSYPTKIPHTLLDPLVITRVAAQKEGPPVQKWMPYKSRRRRPEDAVDRWQGAKNCEKDGIWIYQTWLEYLSFGLMIFKFKAVANNSSFG